MLGAAESDTQAAAHAIDALIARYLSSGLLDDRRYAEAQAASLQRRGASRHSIRQRLAAKGVGRDLVGEALEGLETDAATSELSAACALARRRRLGPYRAAGTRGAHRQKDLATLARAGFSLDIARQVLGARDPAALERLMRGDED